MNDDDGFPAMRGERPVRFGCGALAGLLAGFELAIRIGAGKGGTVLLIAAVAVAFGIAAAALGDRFWRGLRWW